MTNVEIIALVVTAIGVTCFAVVFTILYSSYTTSSIESITIGKRDVELIDEELLKRKNANSKNRKILKVVKDVFFYLVLVFLIPIFIFSMINKFQHNTTMIGNNSVMVVASGSMSQKNEANDYLFSNNLTNQFNTYDIIVLNKVNSPYELRLYDVIAYVNDEGVNVIHRIIGFDTSDPKGIRFETRGDSNNATDKYRPYFEDIIGRYSNKKMGAIGVFVIFFQSYPGIITVVAVVYCLIMINKLTEKVNKVQKERLQKLEKIVGDVTIDDIKDLKITYNEVITFKDKKYYFDEKGCLINNDDNSLNKEVNGNEK